MKIKRVEIVGFKSFVDRVVLEFREGITTVVGPNGCGKSNIVDSIRWAMGEQSAKNLRGRAMEDVIFGGSETRKPLGMAEVSLIFDNDGSAPPALREFAEIMVTRRLYRNGESEYLINQTPCRLLDVAELFMDTGVGARAYSIIEQGKIGMILNAKAEDRRFLIEEAAGVTKYKSRKKAALRKLDATRQNLVRLGDIVSEVRRQMNSLKRQAQKAERYRALREELKGIETRLAAGAYRQAVAERQRLGAEQGRAEQTLAGWEGQVAAAELRIEELRLEQAGQEKAVAQGQERVFHLTGEIQKVESRIEADAREVDHIRRQRERLAAETGELARRLEELAREDEALSASRTSLGADLSSEIRRLGEGEACLEELTSGEREAAARLEQARQSLFALLTELSRTGSSLEEAERRGKNIEERTRRNRAEAVRLREQNAGIQQQVEALESALGRSRQERDALRAAREEIQEGIQLLRRQGEENEQMLLLRREELNGCRSRLETLEQLERNLEGYGQGVRTLLQESGFRERLGPMVADILDVPSSLEAALEAVLGERLQALLGRGAADVLEALGFLRQGEGRCTFVLGNPALEDLPEPAAFSDGLPLAEVVGCPPEYDRALRRLLAGIYLVERLEPFLSRSLPPGVTLVTESGETFGFRGELTGGGKETLNRGVLQKKREIRELGRRQEELRRQVEALDVSREQIREDRVAAEEEFAEAGAAGHRLELKIVDSEKDLFRLRQELARLEERFEVLSLEEDQLHEEQSDAERQLRSAGERRQELEGRRAEQERTTAELQEEVGRLRRELEVVREEVTALKVAVAGIREREEASRRQLERIARQREDLRRQAVLFEERSAEGNREGLRLGQELERLRTELDVLFRRREEEKRTFDQTREAYETLILQLNEQTEAQKGHRMRAQQVRGELTALQLKGRDLELAAELQRQTILDRYRLDLAETADDLPVPAAAEAEADRRRLEDLGRLMADFGEVNLMAVEEFQELEQRFQFLTRQQEDLRLSLEGLQTAITKINRTTRKRFRETFELVNAKFQEVFPRLFRGGKAELRLTDENDLLETGIDIVAQPPGKKLQNVGLLSGGEKALTAVALIFSIFMIKPSPFCLLDEVDAPLDDANIGRFNEMVLEMARQSQFIIITHNKRTMEIADALYGITMEEPGVSKSVSVRLNDF